MLLNELDKTVLLAMLVFTKGSLDSAITEEELIKRFAMRKKLQVKSSLKCLMKNGYIVYLPEENKYKFSKMGLETASQVLHQGAKLWYMK
jgi:phage pi2 protein 07